MMDHPQGIIPNSLCFNLFKDNQAKEMIAKKRKLSINTEASDSTGEKLELNESFKKMEIDSGQKDQSSQKSNSPNYIRFPKPIKPTPKHPIPQTLLLEQIGIQKYLSLDNDQKVSDLLKQPHNLIQKFLHNFSDQQTFSDILGKRETRSFSSGSEREKEKEKDAKQETQEPIIKAPLDAKQKKNQFQQKMPYPYGVPVNFKFLIQSSQDVLKQKIEEEQQKFQQQAFDKKLDQLLFGNSYKISREERAQKVERYLQKKKNPHQLTTRYQMRKELAEKRQRVQGRFVKQDKPKFSFLQSQPTMSQSWEGVSDRKLSKDQRKQCDNVAKNIYEFNVSL